MTSLYSRELLDFNKLIKFEYLQNKSKNIFVFPFITTQILELENP